MKRIKMVAFALLAASTLSCEKPVAVTPGAADVTPASVKIGSANLAPDVDFTTGSAPQPWTGHALASGAADFLISARAEDPESGVKDVAIIGAINVWCHADRLAVAGAQRVVDTIEFRAPIATGGDGSLPSFAVATATVTLDRVKDLCPSGLRVVDWQADFEISATNGKDLKSAPASVSTFAHGVLRAIVHNMFAPGLRNVESQSPSDLNAIFARWAAEFLRHDVILLSEAQETRWVDGLFINMPGFYKSHVGDVAILSRWPQTNIRSDSLTTTFSGQGVGTFPVTSNYVRATIASPAGPIVVYSTHFAHRPAPPETSPNRLQFAERIDADMNTIDPRTTVLVGGDFNSKSRFVGPNDIDFADLTPGGPADEHAHYVALYQGQSVPEIGVLQRRLRDAREEAMADPSRYSHPGGWPVDHLFHRGAFAGSAYGSLPESTYAPSDHAMVRFELTRIKGPAS